uniref:Uncharacterized protein n=1 Tax=Anguilla anguilla TaxID=7936 RepID=A0A0E9RMZ5_ANGAN
MAMYLSMDMAHIILRPAKKKNRRMNPEY